MTVRVDDRTARVENAVKAHAPALLAYFARRVSQSHDAADLLADTLLVLWRRASSIPTTESEVRPWMFGIARHVLMHHYRRQGRQRAVANKLRGILSDTPRAGFVDAAEYDVLHYALATLDAIDRDIIGLIHWEGFSQVEASRILRMKEGTLRSRYHRARAALRAQLEDHTSEGRARRRE